MRYPMYKKLFLLTVLVIFSSGCQRLVDSDSEMEDAESSAPEYGSMTDERDGSVYKTVKIGQQVWFAENLKTTQYKDGTDIPFGEGVDLISLDVEDRVFYFDTFGDARNVETYGRLYTYGAAIKGICPAGWHVSTDGDWLVMEMELGMSYEESMHLHFDTRRGSEIVPKLMATPDLWPYSFGTNESGFNALPAGYKTLGESRHPSYAYFGEKAYFLTTTRGPEGVYYNGNRPLNNAVRRNFEVEPNRISLNRDSNIPLGYAYSVRCVEGEPYSTGQTGSPER